MSKIHLGRSTYKRKEEKQRLHIPLVQVDKEIEYCNQQKNQNGDDKIEYTSPLLQIHHFKMNQSIKKTSLNAQNRI